MSQNLSNGTLEYPRTRRAWTITCQPHIALRLKRVFTRLSTAQMGVYTLSDTPEVCFDLKWFEERYPLEMSATHRAYLGRQAASYSEESSLVDKLLAGIVEPPQFELARPARLYQRISAQMTLTLKGLLNSDETGLGKTIEGICCWTDPRTLPAVVVCLTDCTTQWKNKIQEFAPQLSTHILNSTTPYDLTQLRHRNGAAQQSLSAALPNVIIMNYQKLPGWAETLAKFARMIIWDECQELRTGPGTLRYAAAEILADAADFRLGLSNTPIYNYGNEFYNVFRCIRPDALGTREEFIAEWCGGVGPAIVNPRAFGTYLKSSGLMLQRTAKEVGRQLPGDGQPLVIPQHINSDMSALATVSKSCSELAKIILQQGGYRGQKREAAREFSMKLRQATGIAKAPFIADFVRLMVESGEKPVLFCWHREVYSIILDRLKDLNPVMFTGSESGTQKTQAIKDFVEGRSPIFICSLRAGVGIDGLQYRSRVVITGELDFSPAVHHQNIRRVYRDGQTDIVRAYYLISEFGSDPTVADILGLKTQQANGIMTPDSPLVEEVREVDPQHVAKLAKQYLLQVEGVLPKGVGTTA